MLIIADTVCSLNKKAPLKVGPMFKLEGFKLRFFLSCTTLTSTKLYKAAHWVLYENQQGIISQR